MPLLARSLIAALLTAALLVGAAPAQPVEARTGEAQSVEQRRVRELVNDTRRAKGRSSLTMNRTFAARAQQWARELARCRCLKHRRAPYGAPRGWYAAAENVGRGWSLEQVHRAFMNSPGHRRNILTRRFTHIGTGVVRAPNGEYFVVQAFMDRTP